MAYPECIIKAAKVAIDELLKEFPSLENVEYDRMGFPGEFGSGSDFERRLQMGIYVELIKAGMIK